MFNLDPGKMAKNAVEGLQKAENPDDAQLAHLMNTVQQLVKMKEETAKWQQ